MVAALTYIELLKQRGHKMTKARYEILHIISESEYPITAKNILQALKRKNMPTNKSTVYRELAFLVNQQIINPVEAEPQVIHYELNLPQHRHHLVCLGCKKIRGVNMHDEFSGNHVDLPGTQGFKITHHSLKFFGFCNSCS